MADVDSQTTGQGDTEPGAAEAEAAEAARVAADAKATADVKATADAKAAAEKVAPKGSTTGTETAAAAGPPDTYALTVPDADGFKDQFDTGHLDVFMTKMRRAGLSNERAQVALDALPDEYAEDQQRLRAELEAHPSLGGTQLEAVEQRVKRALDHFLPAGTPDGDRFRRDMSLTGWGNYPPLVAWANAVGLSIAEDRPGVVTETGKGSGEGVDSNDWYDHPTSRAVAQ